MCVLELWDVCFWVRGEFGNEMLTFKMMILEKAMNKEDLRELLLN
jgi:hypothetical protein